MDIKRFTLVATDEDTITDIHVAGCDVVSFGLCIITKYTVDRYEADMQEGNRVCWFGVPEQGKILLINYEGGGLYVFDTVEAALEYVDALYAEEVSK